MTTTPTPLVRRFARNTSGRDLVIGDIHGCFLKASAALADVNFDPARGDRLFSVGDLVDRGPESSDALDWLAEPWFHAVMGNHEDMAWRWGRPGCSMDRDLYAMNGGVWNIANTPPERMTVSDVMADLPLAIEVETASGLVGIVHADCPFASWGAFTDALRSFPGLTRSHRKAIKEVALWSRDRINAEDKRGVQGVLAVVVGHTPQEAPRWLGNVLYIDTAAWYLGGTTDREFAIVDLATLKPAACV